MIRHAPAVIANGAMVGFQRGDALNALQDVGAAAEQTFRFLRRDIRNVAERAERGAICKILAVEAAHVARIRRPRNGELRGAQNIGNRNAKRFGKIVRRSRRQISDRGLGAVVLHQAVDHLAQRPVAAGADDQAEFLAPFLCYPARIVLGLRRINRHVVFVSDKRIDHVREFRFDFPFSGHRVDNK